jgi:hypothetical protein
MNRCHFCITRWVDRAVALAGVELADLARRRLIAGLLSRPHLILSGTPAIGKGQLARALALAGVDGKRDRICRLQGHPWWAAETADVGRFVELQTDFSLWRLAQFADSALNGGSEIWSSLAHPSRFPGRALKGAEEGNEGGTGICSHVVCVERMSPVEIELYFGIVAKWLTQKAAGETGPLSIRLVGTYDSRMPPVLDEPTSRLVALVHLGAAGERGARRLRPGQALAEGPLVTGP